MHSCNSNKINKITVSWDLTPHGTVNMWQYCDGKCCPHRRGCPLGWQQHVSLNVHDVTCH